MKQNEILTGKSYLFYQTTTDHKKDMIGQIVTVIGCKRGGTALNFHGGSFGYEYGIITGKGKKPIRFKLDNGRYANASELKEINFTRK